MKKEDLPQDKSALEYMTREVCYVKNEEGNYTTALSSGWNVKKEALDNAWEDIKEKAEAAKKAVNKGEKSPVCYFMELRMMNLQLLSQYTGYWKLTIKRHLKPSVFNKLNDDQLMRYAKAFNITLEELKNFKA